MNNFVLTISCCVFAGSCVRLSAEERGASPSLYFPPARGEWETVQSSKAGWDEAKLNAALDYAEKNQSSGVVILYRGRILAERYSEVQGERSAKYRQRVSERDSHGGAIEDVASVQKSVASILVGIAQQKGVLKIDDPVSKYLGSGWSRATTKQEDAITIRHLLTMTSGLSDRGTYQAVPGTKWKYNTPVYAKTMDVVTAASGLDRNELTRRWLTQPLGMKDSRWVPRKTVPLVQTNGFGFATTARDLARFGLMMQAHGKWDHKTIVNDQQYLRDATTTSQALNPFYGYLWWLNRNAKRKISLRRLPTAPADLYSASGALNRRCFVVPSLEIVVTRLGDSPDAGVSFDRQFWKLLSAAAPPTRRIRGGLGQR